jgi:transposase InsO family protein
MEVLIVMLDEMTRNGIALKRFSLISPVINKQVENHMAYYVEATNEPVDMPYYGIKKYSPKTLESWYCDYMRGGIDALKPSSRGDKGNFRRIDSELSKLILELKAKYPKAPATVIYEMLVKEQIINARDVSESTVYRFLKNKSAEKDIFKDDDVEMRRFSHMYPGELWQTDVMYGPYIKRGKKSEQTFLFAFIDDATRLITHGEFYFAQNYDVLRNAFKEAVLKRGIPRLIYTDNGKIYRSQQFEWLCASIGCTLIHSRPFVPNSRGKIERFFNTVRTRFLSNLDISEIKSIEELNGRFFKWLNEDYQKKPHSGLNGLSPLDAFMSNISKVNLPDDLSNLKEKFYIRVKRKVSHDATFSIDNMLYETDSNLCNSSIEIRYEPEWIGNCSYPLLVYKDDKNIGEARLVNYHDNSHRRRKGRMSHANETVKEIPHTHIQEPVSLPPVQTISFKQFEKEES